MYGSQSTFRPRGGAGRGRGGRGGRGPPQNPQPNYFPINTLPPIPSPTLPSFHYQQLNPSFQTSPCFNPTRFITREMVEAAVDKARRDLLSSGENVSVWKVSQSAALALQVSSWDSLGFRFSDIPSLRDLQFVEGKVNAFIHCFVTVRRMTSVHELGLEICKSEGVEEFVDLGLGPLVRHPLVRQYFLIPPDLKEVCPIRIDDLVSRLSVFLYKVKNKEFSVEEFLDFLMQKYSVPARENLGVRIQSMGLYIKFIKGARRAESSSLSSIQERGLVTEQPKVLTYPIPNNLNSLSSLCDEYIGETREEAGNFDFGMIDSAHFNRCCQCCPARKKKGKKHGSCKCSASPFFDDFKLIGIKLAMFNHASNGKIPAGNDVKPGGYGAAVYEIMKVDQFRSNQLILSNKQIDGFIETWKGACLKHSVDEILAMMLSTYRATDKQKRKMQRLFLQYPAVGLLNMAVRVLKGENIDVLLQPPDEPASINESSTSFVEQVKSESSSDSEPISDDEKCVPSIENGVSPDFVIKKIGCYFQIDAGFRRKDLTLEKQLILRDCELWLKKQFSVDDFGCLGHGNFLDFLEKHSSALTSEVKYFLTGVFGNKPSMRVFMSQRNFLILLSQAARNFEKASELTEKHVSMLLRKQFPAIVLHTSDSGLGESLNLINEQSLLDVSSFSLAFSASLLGTGRSSLSEGNFSSESAVECLLRAPMLSDLQLWSHWDLVFGPSHGPFLDWLIDLGYVKGLSCIATADGRIIRIDHSVTLDGFLEAIAKGSSFQTAVNLLSLFHVYGGSKRVPLSLIRCYAQAGIDSIIKSCTEKLQANAQETFYEHKNSQQDQEVFSTSNDHGNAQFSPSSVGENAERNRIYVEVFWVNKAHATVSLFILNCLGYQPPEFRSFTAEILVTAFQFFARDAKMIILKGCRGVNERIMLHEIGLDLGIIDWIEDYKEYSSATSADTFQSSGRGGTILGEYSTKDIENLAGNVFSEVGEKNQEHFEAHVGLIDSHVESLCSLDTSCDQSQLFHASLRPGDSRMQAAALFVERIRREEFGLDSDLGSTERNLLKKQHARLGRALHCLSRELYSQDCHFILELVQNADDNNYQENVEPTLVFIVHSDRIVILNNELGFSDKNIRALCDVGNSTKKGLSGGYIGQKGIGFKSVFRITDAPEIHSNGFHVKFDITEGQIGFVLPTIIPPCNVGYYMSVTDNSDQSDSTAWNTCIVLPFKSGLKQGKGHSSIISMFSDLHPSLLLFLHRLNCIVFKSIIEEKLVIMRRKVLSDGIVMVSQGAEKLSWLVVSKSLEASLVRPDVQTTKIAMAFPLEQSGNGDYVPLLDQQPVFAFLPLRKYGLKFIIQGDFVLPSSREEVDEDSAWNQWLLSEMPDLFALAEKSFCALSCFKENPAKAITTFMSFVPLVGEVHGFFSPLPRMILSKLRMSNCLLAEGSTVERAPPFAVLRNWSKDLRTFLTEDLLLQHLGLYYLHKDIRLSDNLARAMGIQEYGPRTLIGLLFSICHGNGINVLGLEWISSWLKAFHVTLIDNSSGHLSSGNADIESDLFDSLGKIPFIPLSDGSYSSLEKGPIWFPCNIFNMGSQSENVFGNLPGLFAELRTVNSLLFSSGMTPANEESRAATVVKVLERIGIQKLSAHDVIRSHILPSIYDGKTANKNMDLMIEYLIYVMFHLQSSCVVCKMERGEILHGLKKNITLLTNHGSICPAVEPIHFGNEFGNAFNVKELVDDMNIKWNEVDTIYLKHPSSRSLSLGLMTWREFFQELGVTDFVQVNQVQRNVGVYAFSDLKCPPCYQDATSVDMLVNDWESPEMISILSSLSSNKCLQKSRYLLEILDKMWDDLFSAKARCQSLFLANEQKEPLQSSFMKCIGNFKWVACSIDEEVHYPKDLFYDCELVHSLLGAGAPYAAPLVTSKRLVEDIGFKVTVTLDDALRVLQSWRTTDYTVASVSQMSKFYAYISEELGKSDGKIIKKVKEDVSIFIPFSYNFDHMDVVSGAFMLPRQLYWHDPTGCLNRIREAGTSYIFANEGDYIPSITLDVLYPELHDFLVTVCSVYETPPSCHYFQILFHLSSIALPSEVALLVFKLMLKWSNDLNSGVCQDEDVLELKEKLLKPESTVLPTVQDKWVSLHPRFGPIYWSDDEKLINEYAHLSNINFLNFGKLDEGEKELLNGQVAVLLKKIGIPVLAEVVSREAIFYGVADATKEAFLINWILPYAQRYLYKQRADIYCNLKESGFLRIMQLQVILVEKLFYRNTLQGNSSTKQKRYECRSLLEDTRLYTTPHADTHTMFLELSRLFFEGTPDLQMANFLYIVAKEFGSAKDEVEFLVVNNLGVPLLPEGETIWSLDGSQKLNTEVSSTQATSLYKRQYPTPRKKTSAKLNWPPTKESTPSSNADHLRTPNEKQSVDASAGDSLIPIEADGMIPTSSETNKSDAYRSVKTLLPYAREDISSSSMQGDSFFTPSSSATNDVSSGSMHVESFPTSVSYLHDETLLLEFKNRDRLLLEAPEEEQSYKTGRLGEMVAYQFFCHKLGRASVQWINEKSEMGLPYDLVVEEEIATRYVEVKATSSAIKDWFSISTNEWNCALEKGESYSIAWVILSSKSDAQVHVFNNPLKLCQQKLLQLAILLPKVSPHSLQF